MLPEAQGLDGALGRVVLPEQRAQRSLAAHRLLLECVRHVDPVLGGAERRERPTVRSGATSPGEGGRRLVVDREHVESPVAVEVEPDACRRRRGALRGHVRADLEVGTARRPEPRATDDATRQLAEVVGAVGVQVADDDLGGDADPGGRAVERGGGTPAEASDAPAEPEVAAAVGDLEQVGTAISVEVAGADLVWESDSIGGGVVDRACASGEATGIDAKPEVAATVGDLEQVGAPVGVEVVDEQFGSPPEAGRAHLEVPGPQEAAAVRSPHRPDAGGAHHQHVVAPVAVEVAGADRVGQRRGIAGRHDAVEVEARAAPQPGAVGREHPDGTRAVALPGLYEVVATVAVDISRQRAAVRTQPAADGTDRLDAHGRDRRRRDRLGRAPGNRADDHDEQESHGSPPPMHACERTALLLAWPLGRLEQEVAVEFLRGASLVVATMTAGLMAGVFGLYANTIMPGLRSTDDRTFVGAFQAIDRRIINPLFMAAFVGALASTGLSAALHLPDDHRSVLPWCLAALVLYLWVFVSTIAVNVPLNDRIKAAGDPDDIADLGAVRAQFDEARWARWNIVRTVASTAAFACLALALVEFGRNA